MATTVNENAIVPTTITELLHKFAFEEPPTGFVVDVVGDVYDKPNADPVTDVPIASKLLWTHLAPDEAGVHTFCKRVWYCDTAALTKGDKVSHHVPSYILEGVKILVPLQPQ